MKLYKGNIIFTENKDNFKILPNAFILEDQGKVKDIGEDLDKKYTCELIDYTNHLLIPGFVDLHFHAVQYGNLGIGLDEELLEWLNHYTFEEEKKFSDLDYAEEIFSEALDHIIRGGTTRIVFFSSIHEGASRLLIDLCAQRGIDAFVGKVNMDRNAPDFLKEDSQRSYEITKRLLSEKSIITPRFVPSCSEGLMMKLGGLAQMGYPVQTHISENESEIEWVKSLHPEAKNYLDVYDQCHLITDRTILAHAVYCNAEERAIIKERNALVAHCPAANFNLTSGIMPVVNYLDKNIRVGLGTDVGAGHSAIMPMVIVQAIQMSKVNHMISGDRLLKFSEAFYMATKGGGSFFGKVGSFEKDYDLDMLVIKGSPLTQKKTIKEQLQRFIYSGEYNMIKHRYCKGIKLE